MFRFRGDAGKTNVVAEFLDEPGLIFLQIVEDSLHRRFVARPARRSKVAAASSGARKRSRSGAASRKSASRRSESWSSAIFADCQIALTAVNQGFTLAGTLT